MVDSSPSPYINRCEGRQLNYACHDATSNYMCHTYAVAVAGTNTAACGGLPDKVLHSSNRWHCRSSVLLFIGADCKNTVSICSTSKYLICCSTHPFQVVDATPNHHQSHTHYLSHLSFSPPLVLPPLPLFDQLDHLISQHSTH